MLNLDFEPVMFLVGSAFVVMGGFILAGGDNLFKCGVVICLFANAISIYKKVECVDIPDCLKDQAD